MDEEAFQRLYGRSRQELFCQFRREQGITASTSISLTEAKEFTYWLFKYRLRYCDPARVASDTRRALGILRRLEPCRARCLSNALQEPPSVIEVP